MQICPPGWQPSPRGTLFPVSPATLHSTSHSPTSWSPSSSQPPGCPGLGPSPPQASHSACIEVILDLGFTHHPNPRPWLCVLICCATLNKALVLSEPRFCIWLPRRGSSIPQITTEGLRVLEFCQPTLVFCLSHTVGFSLKLVNQPLQTGNVHMKIQVSKKEEKISHSS